MLKSRQVSMHKQASKTNPDIHKMAERYGLWDNMRDLSAAVRSACGQEASVLLTAGCHFSGVEGNGRTGEEEKK